MSSLLFALTFALGGEIPSGPMVGDKLPEFKVLGFSGPQEGKEFEAIKETKGGPTLLVVVHKITRPAFQLLRPIDDYASKQTKLATQFIWLGEKDKMEEFLKRAKDSLKIQSPMSISVEADGPMTYGLNDRAAVTVLLAKDNKVVANFAYSDPNATNAPPVLKAIAKLLGNEEPKFDAPKKERPKAKADSRDPELTKLMRQMINKDNDQAAVDRAAEAMRKWAGDDAKKRTELRDFARQVVGLGYGTEAAQAALKKLAED